MKRYLFSLLVLLVAALSPAYAQMNLAACEGLLQTRLNGGMYATVLSEVSVYEQASASSKFIATVPAGTQIYVTSAPSCAEGTVWYQAMYRPSQGTDDFPFGYISEYTNGSYNLEPVAQSVTVPAQRTAISSANITSLSQVAQIELGMVYQSSFSADGQYWMLNGVGANWVYDLSVASSLPQRFTQNPYDTNATHGMTVQDGTFYAIGSASPTMEVQQFGVSSFSLSDATAHETQVLLDKEYAYIGAITADGTMAAAANWQGDIFLYNLNAGSQMTLSGHSMVGILQFSPNGQYLVSVGGAGMAVADTTVRVWDVATGSQIGMLDTGDVGLPSLVAFTPDSSQIMLKPGMEAVLNVYSPDLQLASSIQLPTMGLLNMAFSPDGSIIAFATMEGDGPYQIAIQFYDVNAGTIIHTIPVPAVVKSVAFNPDGTLLSIVYEDPGFWGPNRATLWAVAQ